MILTNPERVNPTIKTKTRNSFTIKSLRTDFVIFAKNTQFYNRIRIGKVNVTKGVAEVLAMETLSARPIENKVAMSLVLLSRQGITGIRSGDEIIQINKSK